MWEVSRGKRITRQCSTCRKDNSLPIKEWSPEIQGWICGLCVEEEEKIVQIEKKLKVLRAREATQLEKAKAQQPEEGGRDVRRTMRPLRKVWMEIGIEKLENHEGVIVKVLLDSGAMGMFVDKKFIEENSFKMEKLERPLEVKNMDGTSNSCRKITHKIECNVFYRGHRERLRMDICDLERTKVILDMPWVAAHNPEINWETGEIKMIRCLLFCGKKAMVKQRNEREKDRKDVTTLSPNQI